jgi:hypothetical protein
LASPYFSETARRVTNLFKAPSPVEITAPPGAEESVAPGQPRRFLEDKLIHRSSKGEPLSSKSEVIIADALAEAEKELGISYLAEHSVVGRDNTPRWPDFTIQDPRRGQTYYWEHLGLLEQDVYRQRWQRKLAWYRDQRVVPYEEDKEAGRLVVTEDGQGRGIDSAAIRRLIREIWGRETKGLDLELFEPAWRPLVAELSRTIGVSVDPGGEVTSDGRVVGSYVLLASRLGHAVYIVDATDKGADLVVSSLTEQCKPVVQAVSNESVAAADVLKALGMEGL